jgi:hypothetical protein
VNTDATLGVFSALQAVTFQWWRADGEGGSGGGDAGVGGL